MCSKLSESQILITEMIHFELYCQTYKVWALLALCAVTGVFYGYDLDIEVEQKSYSS